MSSERRALAFTLRHVELGIALDGEGRLGRPGAVSAVARAADRLEYGSIWCIGPWAVSLAGAVAAVTARIRVGVERRSDVDPDVVASIAPGRAAVGDLLQWVPRRDRATVGAVGSAPMRLDVRTGALAAGVRELRAAHTNGVAEIVVLLVGDPGVDEALAAYAELAEAVEAAIDR